MSSFHTDDRWLGRVGWWKLLTACIHISNRSTDLLISVVLALGPWTGLMFARTALLNFWDRFTQSCPKNETALFSKLYETGQI